MTYLQKKVFMLLPSGLDRLIGTQEIEDILSINKRTIMQIIETLILEYGVPIGSFRNSDNFGYFIASNEKEKEIGIYSLTQQINTMQKRTKRVKSADLELAFLYKYKYKNEIKNYNKQLNIYEYLDLDESETLEIDENNGELQDFG